MELLLDIGSELNKYIDTVKFRTEYMPVRSSLTLDPTRPIVLVGSCFASNIARKMRECMWNSFNGVGTLYNPMSIAKVLELMIFNECSQSDFESSLFEADGNVHSWLFDTHFSASTKEKCLQYISDCQNELLSALSEAQALIVTFGTSWCYSLSECDFHNDNEEYIVANCHKMPASMFRRKRVSVEKISSLWIRLCNRIREKYPELKIIFTVSPVRHLKDGFEENTLSKAILHLAVEQICESVSGSIYFPAYELMYDDLRDYRFYASDLAHPSETAIEYIWEVFCKTFLDEKGLAIIKEGDKRYKKLNHRQILQT